MVEKMFAKHVLRVEFMCVASLFSINFNQSLFELTTNKKFNIFSYQWSTFVCLSNFAFITYHNGIACNVLFLLIVFNLSNDSSFFPSESYFAFWGTINVSEWILDRLSIAFFFFLLFSLFILSYQSKVIYKLI